MPIIRSSRVLYKWLLPVLFGALVFKLSVWCGAEGCVSGFLAAELFHLPTLMQSALNRCTVQLFTESDDTRCCENTICPPEDGHINARNMSRIVV